MPGTARLRLGPRAGLAFVILFGLSTAFPIAAALVSPSGISAVVGVVDVLLAAVLVVFGFTIESVARRRVTDDDRADAWRVVRILATVPLVLLVVFFVRPDLFHWDVLLVGLAWRTWLLLWVLPAVVATVSMGRRASQ